MASKWPDSNMNIESSGSQLGLLIVTFVVVVEAEAFLTHPVGNQNPWPPAFTSKFFY